MPRSEQQAVEAALGSVLDPLFGKPMMELGLIDELRVKRQRVSLRVTVPSGSDELRLRVDQAIRQALAPLALQEVDIDFRVEVPTREPGADDPVPGVRNVILVMSGKGGVGKSTCAVNLALALGRQGTRVGLLDADIYGPSIPTMLGVSESPRSKDGQHIEPLERFGLKLMSIGFLIESDKDAIIWRGPMLQGALQQFLKDVAWGQLDYLVLDLPPGTGDVALTLAQRLRSTGAVIVTTPQEVALQDVYKAVSMCGKLRIPVLGVLENMSYFVDTAGVKHELFGAGGGQKIAEYAQAPLLGQIPIEADIRRLGDDGTPIVQAAPQSQGAQAFIHSADKLAERVALHHFERSGGRKAPSGQAPRRLRIIR